MNGSRIEMAPQTSEGKERRKPMMLEVFETPVKVARNTFRVRFRKPFEFTFVPGQSMKVNFGLELKEDGETPRNKSFTIASAPHEPYLEFVFRVRENENDWSPTKRALMDLKKGELVPMLGVLEDQSDDVIYPPESERGPVVMLAGGVGIAPYISMMRHAAHIGDTRDFHLLYANPTYDDVVYEDEVDKSPLAQKFLTRDSRDGFGEGYFSPESIQAIRESAGKEPLFLISGSEGMVASTRAMLLSLDIHESRIRVKKYTGYTGVDDTIRE